MRQGLWKKLCPNVIFIFFQSIKICFCSCTNRSLIFFFSFPSKELFHFIMYKKNYSNFTRQINKKLMFDLQRVFFLTIIAVIPSDLRVYLNRKIFLEIIEQMFGQLGCNTFLFKDSMNRSLERVLPWFEGK